MDNNKKCQFVKADGSQCEGYAVKDSQFCFSHDSERKEEKREACAKGGSQKRKNLPPIKIGTLADLPQAIIDAINEVRTGALSSKDGNTIAKLLSIYVNMCIPK